MSMCIYFILFYRSLYFSHEHFIYVCYVKTNAQICATLFHLIASHVLIVRNIYVTLRTNMLFRLSAEVSLGTHGDQYRRAVEISDLKRTRQYSACMQYSVFMQYSAYMQYSHTCSTMHTYSTVHACSTVHIQYNGYTYTPHTCNTAHRSSTVDTYSTTNTCSTMYTCCTCSTISTNTS